MAIAAVGLGFGIWRMAHGQSYDGMFDLFTVLSGALLLRGSLKAAKWVQRILTVLVAGVVVALPGLLFLYPAAYWFALVEHLSLTASVSILGSIIVFGAFIWIARQLNRSEVHAAQVAAGIRPSNWTAAAVTGVLMTIAIFAAIYPVFHSATSLEAQRRAAQQYGANFDYVVTKLNINYRDGHKDVKAGLTAYNDEGLRPVSVSWQE